MTTEFKLNRVETRLGPLALVTMDNGEDHTKPTVFGRSAFESAQGVIEQLEQGDWVAMVLTGKPFIFAAGADINEFPKIRTREEASEGSRAGHELFGRIRALSFPTVAAINGACLGGGVEIALHCSARTIARSVRHFGCPEVFLGIFPAWGGTQLVPRLVGLESAIRFVVLNPLRQNKLLDAAKAHELGFADRLLDPVEFVDESIAFALELVESPLVRAEPDHGDIAKTLRKGRSQTDDAVHGAAPAPYRALDLMELACSGATLEEGYRAEEEAIADLMLSPAARRSLYAYDVVERRAKQGIGIPDVPPRKLQKIGIVGAGLMATQLATLFLKRLGVPLVIRDLDRETVDRAVVLDPGRARRALVPDRGHDLRRGLRRLRSRARGGLRGAVDQAAGLRRAARGRRPRLHPRDEHVRALGRANRRRPGPALLQSGRGDAARRARPHRRDRRRQARHGVAPHEGPAQARGARRRRARLRGQPRAHTHDVRAHGRARARQHASRRRTRRCCGSACRWHPPCCSRWSGRASQTTCSSRCTTRIPSASRCRRRSPVMPRETTRSSSSRSGARSVEEITRDVLEAVGDEIGHLLDEGVVADPADVDACLILGAGWPFFLGGITPYLRDEGISAGVAAAR